MRKEEKETKRKKIRRKQERKEMEGKINILVGVVVTTAVSQSFTAICPNSHKCFTHPKMPCTRATASY